jgi:hypothetical protein
LDTSLSALPPRPARSENNLFIGNGTSGLELVDNNGGGGSPIVVRYNTVADNMAMSNAYGGGGSNSDINAGGGLNDACMTMEYNVVKNIAGNPISSSHAKGIFWSPNDASPPISLMDNNVMFSSVAGSQGDLYWGVGSLCLAGHTCSPGGGANCGTVSNTANAGCSGNSFTTNPAFVSETIPGARAVPPSEPRSYLWARDPRQPGMTPSRRRTKPLSR